MDVIYTQYTELFPHHCNTLLLFSFYALTNISPVQVHRNYPSSMTFSQLWRNSSQLARLFKVKVALSPDLNTACWFAKMDLSASVQKQQGRLPASAVQRELARTWKWGFFDKSCLGFRSRYMVYTVRFFFLKWCLLVFANELFIYSPYIQHVYVLK